MDHLFKNVLWQKSLRQAKRIFLLVDFDGTLSEIAPSPEEAEIKPASLAALKSILKKERFLIAVITGRNEKDVRKKINIKKVFYYGLHGLEKYVFVGKRQYLLELRKIKNLLGFISQKYKGVFLEDKGVIFSVHYRQLPIRRKEYLLDDFYKIITPFLNTNIVKIREGKKVIEICPPVYFGKHLAVKDMKKRFSKTKDDIIIYIGDDLTDEDAFGALSKKDISVRVGRNKRTKARFFLKNVDEVADFLCYLSKH